MKGRCDLCAGTIEEAPVNLEGLSLCPSCAKVYIMEVSKGAIRGERTGMWRRGRWLALLIPFLLLLSVTIWFITGGRGARSPVDLREKIYRCREDLLIMGLRIEEVLERAKDGPNPLPERVMEEVERLLPEAGLDPFDPEGGAYRFRIDSEGKTWILYSVGPDGKDDGGAPLDDVTGRGDIPYMGG